MSSKYFMIATALATTLSVSVVRAEGGEGPQVPLPQVTQTQAAAPILHRRTTLPAGWFKQGGTPAALTSTKVNARPVVHFDTVGEEGTAASTSPADRLRRMRASAVLPETQVPQTPPDATAPATGSSRRRVPANVSAPSGVSGADGGVKPIAGPTVAGQASAPVPGPSGQTLSSAENSGAAPSAAKAAEGQSNGNPAAPLATANQAAALPAGSSGQSLAAPPSTAAGATPSLSDTVPLESPSTEIVGVEQLPSVMKRPTLRQDMTLGAQTSVGSPERLTVTVSEPEEATVTPDDVPLSPSPMLHVGAADDDVPVGDDRDGVLIQNQSPVLSVVTRGPKTMVVGKAATFVLDLTNSSEFAAKDVVVRINIPQWVEIVQQNPSVGAASVQPDDSGNAVISWSVDRLQGSAQEKLLLDLIPRGSRPLDLGVTWTFSPARSLAQIQVQEPKLHLSVIGPQDVLFGDTKIYTITVSNPGTGDAENVTLNLLPLVPGEQSAGVRNLGTIPPGGRRTVEVELTTRQTGRLQVRAEATADGGLLARGQQDVIVRRANLEVAVEGPPMKYAGTRARYVIRVANNGDAPATDVVAVVTLPAGAKDVASTDGGSLDPNTGQVQWHVGTLRPGASRVYEMECLLMSPGENRMDLRTVAAGDLSALGSVSTRVESLADLKLTVNDPQGAVAVGADVVYEIKIQNRGTKAAENIQVYGYFSEGVEPVSIGGWRGQVNEGEVVLQSIPRIGAGQEMVVRISAQADRSGDHVFRAELECNDPETKLAVEEWTRFYGEAAVERQADQRRPTPGPSTPVKSLKIQR